MITIVIKYKSIQEFIFSVTHALELTSIVKDISLDPAVSDIATPMKTEPYILRYSSMVFLFQDGVTWGSFFASFSGKLYP